MANTLKIISCGGTGISISDKVVNKLEELGEGFSKIEKFYIDSTDNNINKIEHNPDRFFLIRNVNSAGVAIDGSGGERRTNLEASRVNIKEFIDKHKLNKKATGEYHVVIFSGSGGTGSLLAPLYIKECFNNDIPVIAVCVGDNSCVQFADNTIDTLASLDGIAKVSKKCLSVVYVNNSAFKDKTAENEKKANKYVYNMLSAVSIFLSGENESLDSKDMENFIGLHNFRSIDERHHGLITFILFSGNEINLPEAAIPIAVRSLTIDNISPDLGIILQTNKYGIITNENAKEIYGNAVPMHLMAVTNFLEDEKEKLGNISKELNTAISAISTNKFNGSMRSEVGDDGMVI